MKYLHLTFDFSTYSKKSGEDFAKFCGLLIIYELEQVIPSKPVEGVVYGRLFTFSPPTRASQFSEQTTIDNRCEDLTWLFMIFALKFRHSEKTTKVWNNLPLHLMFTKQKTNQVGDCFQFCGLLRKPELLKKISGRLHLVQRD